MIPELDLATHLDQPTQHAAATTMRKTGQRIGAPAHEIDLVLDVLFAEVLS